MFSISHFVGACVCVVLLVWFGSIFHRDIFLTQRIQKDRNIYKILTHMITTNTDPINYLDESSDTSSLEDAPPENDANALNALSLLGPVINPIILTIPDDFNAWLIDPLIHSNSPRNNNSSSDSDHSGASRVSRHKYHKYTFDEICNSLEFYYNDTNKYSSEMDVLITFIRGQKHLYMQASNLTNFKLYSLYIIAICITSLVTVTTPFIKSYSWSYISISALNAVATALISLINYFKLESSASKYTFMANQYESFENSLELSNNKLEFIDIEADKTGLVVNKIKETEFKINGIRELNQTLIPAELKLVFPVITHINIFSFIKKIQDHKRILIIKFKDVKNEINQRLYHIQTHNAAHRSIHDLDPEQAKQRILFLNDTKDKLKDQLIHYRQAYKQLDYLIQKEIQYAEKHTLHIHCACLFGTPKYRDPDMYSNPVIADYLRVLFE